VKPSLRSLKQRAAERRAASQTQQPAAGHRRAPRRERSIQNILTRQYILLVVIMLGLITLCFSVIQYRTLRADAESSLQNLCSSIGDNIDLQISQMDTICLNAISSSDLRSSLASYSGDEELTNYDRTKLSRHISSLLTSLKGFDYSIRQLNIYHLDGTGFGSGTLYGLLPYSASDQAWYEPAVEAAGRLYLEPDDNYLSLYRLYYNDYHAPTGIVEVRKFSTQVFASAQDPSPAYGMKVYIYREDGTLLYPGGEGEQAGSGDEETTRPGETEQTISAKSEQAGSGEANLYFAEASFGAHHVRNAVTGRREYVCYRDMPESGLLLAAVAPHAQFMRPVRLSLAWIFAIFLIVLALCIVFSTILARRLSSPIRNIYHFLNDESDESGNRGETNGRGEGDGRSENAGRGSRFRPLIMEETGVREIDNLKNSINASRAAQREAQQTLLTLKEKELQAQMLALQNQMNPHFLYNSLSNIVEMAQEGLTEEVAQMAQAISEILRYISSNREQVIALEEELELASLYLECIRMRFGDKLQYRFDIDDDMLERMVPKLCVQLLIENAIKASTSVSPPWEITIKGWIGWRARRDDGTGINESADGGKGAGRSDGTGRVDKVWYLTVMDNGPGFDPEVDKKLRHQMDEILESGILPGLQIEGMGILNIFIRLYLLDGIKFIFDFGNRTDLSNPDRPGAFVTIGGFIND